MSQSKVESKKRKMFRGYAYDVATIDRELIQRAAKYNELAEEYVQHLKSDLKRLCASGEVSPKTSSASFNGVSDEQLAKLNIIPNSNRTSFVNISETGALVKPASPEAHKRLEILEIRNKITLVENAQKALAPVIDRVNKYRQVEPRQTSKLICAGIYYNAKEIENTIDHIKNFHDILTSKLNSQSPTEILNTRRDGPFMKFIRDIGLFFGFNGKTKGIEFMEKIEVDKLIEHTHAAKNTLDTLKKEVLEKQNSGMKETHTDSIESTNTLSNQ